jgi:eukaryotic-like serine/threonine-protein kinase
MVGDVLAGRYELEQLVGAGGMSSVYRAHDRVLERTVALKVLHERLAAQGDILDRFRREAKLVAGLSHHNIVAVIDRGEDEGRPFIVFEFVDGENLKQLVVRSGPLPVERALELAIQVAHGLAFAHAKGFVHRDVKPQNVLLNGNGEAKVTDFGIARALDVQEGETQTGTVLGTCDYIAPEQAQGRRVDEHTDVYSLGIVLYELLTGEVPFTGENFVAVAMQHINAPPPPVSLRRPEVPARVDAAVERALAKDPAGRFPTMAAFCDELEACLDEVRFGDDGLAATGVLPVVKPVRDRRRRRRRLPVALAAVALLAAVAAVLAVVLTRGGGSTGGGGGPGAPVDLRAAASYDPYGNNHTENPQLVPYATDGKPSTAWSTEDYRYPDGGLGKAGVGLVLEAPAGAAVHTLTVSSDTPGYTAEIEAGSSATGPFSVVSQSQLAGARTTWTLSGATGRYLLIWITNRGSAAAVDINEVTADS